MTATTIDYRMPGTRNGHALAERMRVRERGYQAAAWGMLAAGCAATVVAPLVVSWVIVSVQHRLAMGFHWAPLGFGIVFPIACVVVIPLAFWWEKRTGGTWYEAEVRAQGTTVGELHRSSSRGEWELRRTAAYWTAIIEVALWGPRMVMSARERWSAKISATAMHEAAAIVHYLRHFDGGVLVTELPSAGPTAALRYLISRDWVGVAKAGDRVWLLSEARKHLE